VNEAATVAHLTPLACELLQEPDERRIRAILGERWVLYPRAKQALDVLNRLAAHPRTTRMPSVAIYGDSGMGKTMIMQRFCTDHPARFDFDAGVKRTPVLALQMSGKPGERRLYAQLLAALGAPPGPRASVVDLEQAALRLMRAIGVQVLVIDEVHNILAGSYREQRVVLNTLRFLSNELKLSLVCFGVAEAREAISGDVQLARRFDELVLKRWSANAEFEALVTSILRNLPLREPSVLSARTLRRVLQVTEGLTARVFRLFNELAVEAIESGRERITDEAVERWRPVLDTEAAFA
jgi:TniB protein